MNRSQRLQPVKKIAENREKEAANELGKAQKRLDEMLSRLKELKQYREEYTRNFMTVGAQGMGVARMLEYRAFLAKIDGAVDYQTQVVEQVRRDCDYRQRVWGHLHGRVLALDKVATRYRHQEDLDADRRLQKETDERAQRRRTAES